MAKNKNSIQALLRKKCCHPTSQKSGLRLVELKGEHITDIYITENGTTELENLSHNIIDIFIIET